MNAMLVEAAGIGLAASLDRVTAQTLNRIEARLGQSMADVSARIRKMPPVSEVVMRLVRELTTGKSLPNLHGPMLNRYPLGKIKLEVM